MAAAVAALPGKLPRQPPPPPPPPSPPNSTFPRYPRSLAAHPALSSSHPSDVSALLAAAARAGDLRLGRALHRKLLRGDLLDRDAVVANSLLTLYSRCGAVASARNVFDGMRGLRDIVSWTAMASCLARNGAERGSLLLIGEMLESGLLPNAYTLCAAAHACFPHKLYCLVGGVVLGLVHKMGLWGTDVAVGSALIDMLARNGDLASAHKVFDGLIEKTVVVWTLLISRYVQGECAEEAVELFLDFLEDGFEPDRYTMSSMISACTELGSVRLGLQLHSLALRMGLASDACVSCGLVDMYAKSNIGQAMDYANKVFERMPKNDVISWTALISGYVQSGVQENKVMALFGEMLNESIKPNHITYSSILKSCASISDHDSGRQVHAHVIKSNQASAHTVGNALVSMYAESGCMEEARRNTTHEFRAGDTSHPRAQDIYGKLDTLVRQIKGMGYVPDTSIVLHDMSDELKEQYLLQHSEKIAVAFGLITTSAPKPIRIFKNLRVCADCHSAIKYMSKATRREIILRDSNRFHRMKDGECSCGEYW
uniref:DYW domain-containing protein n=1 Tax=Oryza glumipatula TaxID=40148 RepID=A0A0D9ZVP5_9ORYZ